MPTKPREACCHRPRASWGFRGIILIIQILNGEKGPIDWFHLRPTTSLFPQVQQQHFTTNTSSTTHGVSGGGMSGGGMSGGGMSGGGMSGGGMSGGGMSGGGGMITGSSSSSTGGMPSNVHVVGPNGTLIQGQPGGGLQQQQFSSQQHEVRQFSSGGGGTSGSGGQVLQGGTMGGGGGGATSSSSGFSTTQRTSSGTQTPTPQVRQWHMSLILSAMIQLLYHWFSIRALNAGWCAMVQTFLPLLGSGIRTSTSVLTLLHPPYKPIRGKLDQNNAPEAPESPWPTAAAFLRLHRHYFWSSSPLEGISFHHSNEYIF